MYDTLGSLPLTVKVSHVQASTAVSQSPQQESDAFGVLWSIAKWVLIVLGILVGLFVLFVLVMLVRKKIVLARRRRRKTLRARPYQGR